LGPLESSEKRKVSLIRGDNGDERKGTGYEPGMGTEDNEN
jgi:hypothetical protein